MKSFTYTLFSVFIISASFAQVTIESNTLPDVGDVLEYTLFTNYQDTLEYRKSGADVSWNLGDFSTSFDVSEEYIDINTTTYADSFPDANMLVELQGFQGAAIRGADYIDIVGIVLDDFIGFDIDPVLELDQAFRYRQTPVNYGDEFDGGYSFALQFHSSVIPGLDTIELPIQGTLDSIRITYNSFQREEATGWGSLSILGNDLDVLQVQQQDSAGVLIEAGLTVLGFFVWIDASDFFDVSEFGLNFDRMSYKFLAPDSKESIVEFTENRITDSTGTMQLVVNGRMKADLMTGVEYVDLEAKGFTLYPNPAANSFVIEGYMDRTEEYGIWIIDYSGRVVYLSKSYIPGQSLFVGELPAGLYSVLLSSDNIAYRGRLMIQ